MSTRENGAIIRLMARADLWTHLEALTKESGSMICSMDLGQKHGKKTLSNSLGTTCAVEKRALVATIGQTALVMKANFRTRNSTARVPITLLRATKGTKELLSLTSSMGVASCAIPTAGYTTANSV
jgi:hypothetical protein